MKTEVEAGYIPGIYEFCDRWCDRCTLREKCMSYAIGRKLEQKGDFDFEEEMAREEDNSNIWIRFKNLFESTYVVLQQLADEKGIDFEDLCHSENINKEALMKDYDMEVIQQDDEAELYIESSDITKIVLIYEELSERCLEVIYELIDEKDKQKTVGGNTVEDIRIENELDIISWYVDILESKTRRALFGYFMYYDALEEGGKKSDFNGSAKVALLAIEYTLNAWENIRSSFKDLDRDISHIQVVLKQLVQDIEKQFPKAREFRRPGFDQVMKKK